MQHQAGVDPAEQHRDDSLRTRADHADDGLVITPSHDGPGRTGRMPQRTPDRV